MSIQTFESWLDEIHNPEYLWFVKRLSANDTGLTGAHQVGLYLPKNIGFRIFPSFIKKEQSNPKKKFKARTDSHDVVKEVQATLWNQKTRNEIHVTQWGGKESPFQDPEATGALVIFSFHHPVKSKDMEDCRIWLCRDLVEEELFEQKYGPVEPGQWLSFEPDAAIIKPETKDRKSPCWLDISEIPPQWLKKFPSGEQIIEKTVTLGKYGSLAPDHRLLKRRSCEYELFRSVEHAVLTPVLKGSFGSVDEFLSLAQSTMQRRKSRSGKSLELHMSKIFDEEGFVKGKTYSVGAVSENGKKPDFLFPSADCYRDKKFPSSRLRMMGAKTTVKDRWRQVVDEANRIGKKHLLTLQEGVSATQMKQMEDAGVVLVVPKPLHLKYPEEVRGNLVTISDFIREIKSL